MTEVRGHHVVLGLGRSGEAVASYLARLAEKGEPVSVTVLDSGAGEAQRSRACRLEALGIPVLLGVEALPDEPIDHVIASPGLPPHSALMSSAAERGVPIESEVEFAFRIARSPIVAVTGTNGKTTTTSLVDHLLTQAGIPSLVGGNIGRPLIDAAAEAGDASLLVAEVSSFQLAYTRAFRPKVSILLNITPDHIDWHGSMQRYAEDKALVFANQTADDVAVIDVDDAGSAPYADSVSGGGVRVVRVSRSAMHSGGAGIVDGMLALDTPHGVVSLVRSDELAIRGEHNVSNALAAAAACYALGAPVEALRDGLRSFRPIEHRLEPVATIAGAEYFNDSKATNPDSVLKALTAFDERPIVVLLGGRNKHNDFHPLAAAVARRCKAVVLFGEAGGELEEAFTGLAVRLRRVASLRDAVAVAPSLAETGDVVLLSPACASFDEFADYEERGRMFKRHVLAMVEEAS